ncbi:MAG TPA: hypothetical protein VGZ32_12625 [Actinocrinis sp.]|jgi:hypothetical protein|uniref:hypothetical protein n=1 Tax=Actinocrinis sp. TaxID=1920516 RepID=UPI002DDD2BDB|nr:hypothetical protein [Actinocrinis sp.]HEV3171185.1 hypothetical protein [Actinocrinis sp.]
MDWLDGTHLPLDEQPHHPRAARRPRLAAPNVENVDFESIGARIPAALVAASPTLMMVAAEDVCWRIARDALRAARPSRLRRRAYAAWYAKMRSLDEKCERLRILVDESLAAF